MGPARQDTKLIPLAQGKFTIVDAEDYDWLSQHKWYAHEERGRFYARRRRKDSTIVAMHREIMHPPKGLMCDHKDHNGLHNRKSNLPLCGKAENQYNRQQRTGCSSRYKGVDWHRGTNKWRAGIRLNQKFIHLGLFDNETDAAIAYDDKAVKLFGKFACVNFPRLIEFRKWLKKLIWTA